MIVDTQESKCTLKVLSMLDIKKCKYNQMFRMTKMSHTTLQRVLNGLTNRKLIMKYNLGHMNVDYEITEKGRESLRLLKKLQDILT